MGEPFIKNKLKKNPFWLFYYYLILFFISPFFSFFPLLENISLFLLSLIF